MKRKPRRLYDARDAAVANLKRAVAKRHGKLLSTASYPIVEEVEAARGARGPSGRRRGLAP